MTRRIRLIVSSAIAAVLTMGCAPVANYLAALDREPQLEAWGPGTVFPTVEAAALDALVYSYREAVDSQTADRIRAGTIFSVAGGYSYDEILVAGPLDRLNIYYTLRPRDVARFQMYPLNPDSRSRRSNERASPVDRRSVQVTDPLRRPLFILHPSLVVREYRGEDYAAVEIADLRSYTRDVLIAGE